MRLSRREESPGDLPVNSVLVSKLSGVSRFIALLIISAGGLVLFGWAIGNQALMRVVPGFVAMNPLSAACFIAAGLSLVTFREFESTATPLRRSVGLALALMVAAVAAFRLLEYAFNWRFGLDQLLFGQKIQSDYFGLPNRMAPNTGFNFLLSSWALILLHSKRRAKGSLVQNLSLIVLFHSLLAVLGYVYSANYLYGAGSYIPMALHTAVLFVLFAAALLFTQCEYGVMALFTSKTTGGVVARRLLPLAFIIPASLGALRLWGEKHGAYNVEFGVTLMVLLCIAAFVTLIWWNAAILNRMDVRRLKAEAALQRAYDNLEIRVKERTAELTASNENLKHEIAERLKAQEHIREQADEKRELEQQLFRSQRMESIGTLAGGIAHDLNNALVPVLMGTELLRERAEEDPEQKQLLELISTSGKRCTEMVRQILSFARGTQNKSSCVPLRRLMLEMAKIARDTFPKSIVVECIAPNDLWDANGDSTEIHQVLMNLCVNARDAMPEGGRLLLRAENLSSVHGVETESRPANYVLLTILDTGTGIPPELRSRIFEPFFTTKEPGKGTGLGLSTVSTIVKRHKGFVELDSAPGNGTSFKIYLPAGVRAPETNDEAKTSDHPLGNGELILLADDEQMVLELARTTLENYGYRILTAANGLEAVAVFEAHRAEIQLILIDTGMPFLDGFAAIRQIRRFNPLIPIILASATKMDTERFIKSGIAGLQRLNKPYGMAQLLEGVAAALGRGKNEALT